jgi:sRNA-binding protein
MKYWQTALAILAALYASIALAEDFKTTAGKEYKNATVSHVEPDGIVVKTKSGIAKIYFIELPKEVQKRFGYDTDKLEAEKAAARAAQEKRIREEKEREGNADADLKQSLEKFQSAEQRAAQSYQNTTKGVLSGQVFVSTIGGENRKLGAVQVGLYARDAIDILLAGLKMYADIKIRELSPSVDAAQAAKEQADGIVAEYAARDEYEKLRDKRDFYYSGAFFFAYLPNPIQAVETDADGKFAIEVPKQGSFVIAAKAERFITEINWKAITEHYYWLQPVSLEGQQQRVQNLSNNNLTSTTGSSSLIHTQN